MEPNANAVYWIGMGGDVVCTLPPLSGNNYEINYDDLRDFDWTTFDCDVCLLYKEQEVARYYSKLQRLYIIYDSGNSIFMYHLGWSQFTSINENAINLLEKNQDKINWHQLSKNPSIFE
tara:strand:- start:61 stop:417 length:357 start_codon:yes stop_codon:yes gene_type:complete